MCARRACSVLALGAVCWLHHSLQYLWQHAIFRTCVTTLMVRLSPAGSLAALQNMQPPRSRSGSLLDIPEADTAARSPSPFSSVIVRRSGTACSDSSLVSSRQSPPPSVSPEPSPVSLHAYVCCV